MWAVCVGCVWVCAWAWVWVFEIEEEALEKEKNKMSKLRHKKVKEEIADLEKQLVPLREK